MTRTWWLLKASRHLHLTNCHACWIARSRTRFQREHFQYTESGLTESCAATRPGRFDLRSATRERVALAEIKAGRLLGDVFVTGCTEISPATFAAHEMHHCISDAERKHVIGNYKKIFAWHIAAPPWYPTPVPFALGQTWKLLRPHDIDAVRQVLCSPQAWSSRADLQDLSLIHI